MTRLPCLDARGSEGWTCVEFDGTGLWCDNCLQVSDVPAAPAGTADPVSVHSRALPDSSHLSGLSGRVRTNLRRLLVREGGEGRRRNNLQGESR